MRTGDVSCRGTAFFPSTLTGHLLERTGLSPESVSHPDAGRQYTPKGPRLLGVLSVIVTSSLRRILAADLASEPDAELLARFAARRDEAAFAALFDRHGPMVRAVCRRYCRDLHLAADAEQGVWLVLARRAAAVSRPERLANWLFGVAVRVGQKAAAAARPGRGLVVPAVATPDVAVSVLADELLRVLDEELTALPEHERLPLVLCYLEGRTQDEAARVCGTAVRTLRRWLDRGRVALRRRLERRGVAPAAAHRRAGGGPDRSPGVRSCPEGRTFKRAGPSSLSPWIAEELAMTGTRTWWLRVALVVGLGLGGLTAAVWSAADKPVPADSTRRPRRNRRRCPAGAVDPPRVDQLPPPGRGAGAGVRAGRQGRVRGRRRGVQRVGRAGRPVARRRQPPRKGRATAT